MKLRKDFPIGLHVLVKATVDAGPSYERVDHGSMRRIQRKPLDPPRIGCIVGVGRLCEGVRHAGCGYGEDAEPGYLEVTHAEDVWLVRFGMVNKPVKARQEDLEITTPGVTWKFPWRAGTVSWPADAQSKEAAEAMRAEMRAWPRDAKGHWLKTKEAQEYAMRQLIDVHGMVLFTRGGPGIPTIEILRLLPQHYTKLPESQSIRHLDGIWSHVGNPKNNLEFLLNGWLSWGIERHSWVKVLGILRGAV